VQLPNLQFIKSIPVWGTRLYEAFKAVQEQATNIETQGNLNATGDPPVPPPPDALNVTNGPSGEFQIAITHNGQFNRGVGFKVQHDTSPNFTNPHPMDLGDSRNDDTLYLPGQTLHFRASAAYPNGPNSAWTYYGTQNRPTPVIGGVRGVRAPGMGSGTGAPGDQSGGPGPVQQRNAQSGYDWTAQQRTAGAGFGASAQGSPAGLGASTITGGGGGGGGVVSALIIVDVYANWTSGKNAPGNYPVGTLFVISDRNNLTYQVQTVSSANTWVYYEGTYFVTQSAISAIKGYNATALGVNDTGLLISVTDYAHVLKWSGTAWGWGPGESGSGYFSDFAVAPTGSGWQACLSGETLVTMEDGSLMEIRELVNSRSTAKVIAYDPINNEFLPRALTDWSKTKATKDDWTRISVSKGKGFGRRSIVLTKDHRVYLEAKGWTQASDVQVGDCIIRREKTLTSHGEQALIGMFFGDGSIDDRGIFRTSHCEAQYDYVNRMAGKLLCNLIPRVRKQYVFGLPLKTTSPKMLRLLDRKKKVRRDLLDSMGPLGLAIWYCDDGNLQTDKRDGKQRAQLHTEGFSDDEVDCIMAWFFDHGMVARSYSRNWTAVSKKASNRYIRLDVSSSAIFFEAIKCHVPPEMRYKLPSSLANAEYIDAPWMEFGPVPLPVCAVGPLREYDRHELCFKYDISVSELHSFIADGFVAHNCDGSAGVKYLKADGTTGTVTVPNTVRSSAYRKNGAAYSSTIAPAQAPTVTPTGTISASGSFAGAPSGSVTVQSGTGASAAPPFTPTGSVSVSAAFSGVSDTTVLPGDPIPNYQAITYFRQ
jgi:LAGLIDADG DNA endonuclease family